MIIDALLVSLKVTTTAVFFSFTIGLFLARFMTKKRFKAQQLIEIFIMLPMFLPPSVVGYILLLAIGRRSIAGALLNKYFGTNLTFTWIAAVIAAFAVSLPLMYQGAKGAFLSIDSIYEEAAKVMGASETTIFCKIVLPMAARSILSSLILTLGRAFGEFGATLMVAGNIPGKTQTIPIAMYYAVETGETFSANVILLIILGISFSLIFIQNYLLNNKYSY